MPQAHYWVRHLDGPTHKRWLRVTFSAASRTALGRSSQCPGYFVVEDEHGQPVQLWQGGRRVTVGPLALSPGCPALEPSRS